MFRPIVRLWVLIFVPFAVLPFTFLSGIVVPYTALWGHAVFHLIYLPILGAGWWALWRFVRKPSNLALRVRVARFEARQSTCPSRSHLGQRIAGSTHLAHAREMKV